MNGTMKKITLIMLLIVVALGLHAQAAADPNADLYRYIDLWEGRGYLRNLPPFRPFPEPLIISLLERVTETGDAEAQEIARRFRSRYSDELSVDWELEGVGRTDQDDVSLKAGIGLNLNGAFTPRIHYSGGIKAWALDQPDGEVLPTGDRTTYDIVEDNAKISAAGREIATLLEVKTSFTLGTDSLYLQSGIMRRSFGPFHDDSVVLSGYAPQSGNYVFHYQGRRFSYSSSLFALTAPRLYKDIETQEQYEEDAFTIFSGDPAGDGGTATLRLLQATGNDEIQAPGKFMHLNAFTFYPFERWSFSIFESVVWGPSFQPAYLVPFKFLWQAQSISGFADNSFIGLTVEHRPIDELRLPLIIYVDDANFNEIAQFKLDTKYKLAAQTGAIWTPAGGVIQQVQGDYTIVTPYMYTHDGPGIYSTEPNYTNYVHRQDNLGTTLEPNSDRINLAVTLVPVERLTVILRGRFIRHANASEGVLNGYGNDGSIYDDGREFEFGEDPFNEEVAVYDQGRLSFQEEFRFMTQDNIERTYQGGLDLSYRLPFASGALHLEGSYLFEYVQDPIEYSFDFGTYTGETVVLPDETNHYFSLGARLVY